VVLGCFVFVRWLVWCWICGWFLFGVGFWLLCGWFAVYRFESLCLFFNERLLFRPHNAVLPARRLMNSYKEKPPEHGETNAALDKIAPRAESAATNSHPRSSARPPVQSSSVTTAGTSSPTAK